MGTFVASKKVSGRLEPSNSSPIRPVPASIRPLMSAFECSGRLVRAPAAAKGAACRPMVGAERRAGQVAAGARVPSGRRSRARFRGLLRAPGPERRGR